MKIAIIGAGFSGCNLYNNLKERFDDITIFEKSRGVGGRISTKYVEDRLIDHGTSHIIPITDDLKSFCIDLVKNDILKSKYDEFLPKNGMNNICKFLINEDDLVTNTKIVKCSNETKRWILQDENGETFGDFDLLFITIPAPQILQMQINLPEIFDKDLQNIEYNSVFSLILYSNDKVLNEDGCWGNQNVEEIVNNSKKYGYKDFKSYVIHSSKAFANRYNELKKEDILEIFLKTFEEDVREEIKEFNVIPHLWKYAFAKNSLDMPYFYDKELQLGICGDYFNFSNLEASLLSSELLGNIDFKK